MVVVCQKCRTRFQLDEARIPLKGVRVRCSKCKHAFLVAPPATEDSTLHRLAEQAAATGRAAKSKPGPQLDLPDPGEANAERFSAAAAAGEPEDDWEFNTDTPGPGEGLEGFDDSTPPPAEITDSEPTENDAVESFFELDGLRDPGPERGAEPAGKAASSAGRAAAPQPAREAPRPAAAKPATPKPAAPPAPRSKKPIEPEQEVGFEDLGDPDSWDFGSEAKRSEPAPPAKAPAPKRKAPAPAQVEAAPTPRARAAPAAATGRAGAAANAVAWVLAFGLFSFGLRGVLVPSEAVAQFPAAAVGALEIGSLRVRHVENFWAGPLVVVAGELRNPGGAPAKAGAVPRLRVSDAAGAPLEVSAPWLGSELSERSLREEDPAVLAAELARSARALAERSLAPNESVRVQAVLAGLPPGAGAFAVEGAPLASLPAPPTSQAAERVPPSAEAPAAEAGPEGAAGAP